MTFCCSACLVDDLFASLQPFYGFNVLEREGRRADWLAVIECVKAHHYDSLQHIHHSYMDHFVYMPSQWEMMLHCNVVSHWLGACTKWSLSLNSQHDSFTALFISGCVEGCHSDSLQLTCTGNKAVILTASQFHHGVNSWALQLDADALVIQYNLHSPSDFNRSCLNFDVGVKCIYENIEWCKTL